jgi:hypothetical protein
MQGIGGRAGYIHTIAISLAVPFVARATHGLWW